MRKLTIEEVKNRLFAVHDNTITLDESTYKNTGSKSRFVHIKYGEWWARTVDVLNGRSHPKGSMAKRIDTVIKKYGVDHPNKSAKVREKISKSSRIPVERIEKRLFELYGDLVRLDISTYVDTTKKATFIHITGHSWQSTPDSVLRGHIHSKFANEKRQKTCLERYGVPFLGQNREIALKQAKAVNGSVIKFHWKTNEELVCRGSWEAKVIDFLNKNRTNFLWQPKIFTMPNGKTYRPDLFFINENKWIEIKGWMRKDAQEKWDWFKTQFPTAELWEQNHLKKMNIL